MTLTIGSLFSGYGGLDLAVEDVLDGETVWTCDVDPGASRILRRRFPHAPNLGDITAVDWSAVEPVEILTGGFPCQDVSHAGARAGLQPGNRSGLWARMADAIDHLRPALVVAENVRGLLSAAADSDVEPCPWCMGGAGDGEPALRALGSVLADLAELGYDAAWHGLRAADVGAPHGRFRVFVLAWPSDTEGIRRGREWVPWPGDGATADGRRPASPRGCASATADADRIGPSEPPIVSASEGATVAVDARGEAVGTRAPAADACAAGAGRNGRAVPGEAACSGRPDVDIYASRDARRGHVAADAEGDGRDERWPESAGHVGRPDAAERGAATPDTDGAGSETFSGRSRSGHAGRLQPVGDSGPNWGTYEPAVRRWESVLGRPAPAPTELSPAYVAMVARRRARLDPRPVGRRGSLRPVRRLSPRFVEWMMGLPDGWVTDVPGLSRNDQLKALGNGVVPQQAAAALRILLAWRAAAVGQALSA